MKNKRRISKKKKINPKFWVFCEGETEEAYISFLRAEYRLPVEIITKISGSRIDTRFINSFKKGKPTVKKDRDFLIYDADVPDIITRLNKIENAILIASMPAIELWFLLHYKNQTSYLTESTCIRELDHRNRNTYKKGVLDPSLKSKLKDKRNDACSRAKRLQLFDNPSTNMYIFIEALEKVKLEKLSIQRIN